MDRNKLIFLGLLLIVPALLVSGCTQPSQPADSTPADGGTTPADSGGQPSTGGGETGGDDNTNVVSQVTALKTCAEENGNVCGVGDECSGDWLDVSDTFSCCSASCESGAPEDLLEIELFETNPENEDLGPVV